MFFFLNTSHRSKKWLDVSFSVFLKVILLTSVLNFPPRRKTTIPLVFYRFIVRITQGGVLVVLLVL